MQIDVVRHYSHELQREIAIALPGDRTDTYLDGLRRGFRVPPTMAFLLKGQRGISRFVDVGANIGAVTVSAAALQIECLAVEAETRNYVLLCETIAANGFTNVRPVHAAASDASGVVDFVGESAWGTMLEHANEPSPDQVTTVPALPLDVVLSAYGFGAPDLIKIDVEGHEAAVVRGLVRTLETARPLLVFESNTWMLGGVAKARQLLELVEAFDYLLYRFLPDGTVVARPSHEVQPAAVIDYLAAPREASDRALPTARAASFGEDRALMEVEPLDSGPHVLHLCQVIASFEEAQDSRALELEGLKGKIASGDRDVLRFVREHYPGPLPSWLVE